MSFLLDTNVVSELRKAARCDHQLLRWHQNHPTDEMFLSVLTTGEIRRGVESCRTKEPTKSWGLERWLEGLELAFENRILPVTAEIADLWGRLPLGTNMPVVDGLLAATAAYYELTVVTRNERDFQRSGVDFLNPFKA